MTTERLLVAGAFVMGGLALGAVAGWLIRRRLLKAPGGDATKSMAGIAGLFAFWFLSLIGALLAVALIQPETLQDVPRQLLDYMPRLLAAALILFTGYAVAVAASRLLMFGLERASGRTARRAGAIARWVVLAAAILLALAQLGVDTTVLLIVVGLAGFGVVLAGALLVGLGGRPLAREISAGRYVARFVDPGMYLESGARSGTVVGLHPATLELENPSGGQRHVPYSQLLTDGFTTSAAKDRAKDPPSEARNGTGEEPSAAGG